MPQGEPVGPCGSGTSAVATWLRQVHCFARVNRLDCVVAPHPTPSGAPMYPLSSPPRHFLWHCLTWPFFSVRFLRFAVFPIVSVATTAFTGLRLEREVFASSYSWS